MVAQQSAEDIQRQVEEMEDAFRENAPAMLEALDALTESKDAPPAFRINWLKASTDLRNTLRGCVGRLRIAESISFQPIESGFVFALDIINTTDFPIGGITLKIEGEEAASRNMNGDTRIEFAPLAPGETLTYLEDVQNLGPFFDEPRTFEVSVVDVLDDRGYGIISVLFGRRYPGITSMEDLEFALQNFCWMPIVENNP